MTTAPSKYKILVNNREEMEPAVRLLAKTIGLKDQLQYELNYFSTHTRFPITLHAESGDDLLKFKHEEYFPHLDAYTELHLLNYNNGVFTI